MTSPRLLSALLGIALGSASLLASAPACAQDPVAPAVAIPPAAPPAPSTITKVSGEYTCVIVERGELSDLEARTASDMICAELVKQKAHAGQYTVSFGRLGSRTRLAISDGTQSREAWLLSLDELQAASARTIDALSTNRSVSDTENVDNVLASEATSRRTKPGQLGGGGSLIGATTIGEAASVSTGFGLSLHYNAARYGILAEGRALGIGSAKDKLVEVSAGLGARFFLSDSDFSPFLGGGLQVVYYQLGPGAGSSGAGAYTEIGVAGLRSSKVGIHDSLRGALPFFTIKGDAYVVPVTLNLGLTFL